MRLSKKSKGLAKLVAFRSQMKSGVIEEVVTEYWGDDSTTIISDELGRSTVSGEGRDAVLKSKKKILDKTIFALRPLVFLGLVKYIGLSGSIAAGTYKQGDDIDLFIVVNNGGGWILRGVIKVLLFGNARMVSKQDIADTLCINYIVEERATKFLNSPFVMHEILHLISVFGGEYKCRIIATNKWLEEVYGITPRGRADSSIGTTIGSDIWKIILWPINLLAFIAQITFMIFTGHRPRIKQYWQDFLEGRAAFHPQGFREESEEKYLEALKELYDEIGYEPKA